jgi:hypothetical protein
LELYHSSQHLPPNFLPERVTEHTYFCYQGLKISEFVIGIPEAYFDDAARGHALYVTGVSFAFNLDMFEKLFRKCGTVKKSVAVIDMISEETFRWVIMSSFEEAQNVRSTLQLKKFGAQTINICHAFAPGTVIWLGDRNIANVYCEQHEELWTRDQVYYAQAILEYELRRPPILMTWYNKLISASVADRFEESTAESSFIQSMQYDNLAPQPQFLSPTQMNISQQGETSDTPKDKGKIKEKAESPTTPLEKTAGEGSGSNVAAPLASQAVAPIIAATPAIPPLPAAPFAPVVATSSWANIAAPSATANASRHLMFDLHPENKSSSSAPRVQAPVNPDVIAHAKGEPIEEQMRVVFIFNLPPSVTLKDVSDAVSEGPVLNIKFAADTDNGNRYAGIVFQYAQDAHAFYQVLLEERANSTPGRFRFIVDAGRDTPYPYDEELEMMGEPMFASRRLTIVKKGFFFQFTKRQLRQLCEKLVGPEKIQLIWLYNGGNGTVVFSEVKSAVTIKTELDRMAVGKGKGNVTAVFADLHTTFSKDPCVADLRLITDIEELNAD